MIRSLHVHSNSAHESSRVRPVGDISIQFLRPIILSGLSEGLEGMRAGGVRRVHLTPALVGDTWGHDGLEDLKDESLDLGQSSHLYLSL